MQDVLASLGPAKVISRDAGTVEVEVEIPEAGIGDHMAGVLRVLAGGTVELATPPWGLRPTQPATERPAQRSARRTRRSARRAARGWSSETNVRASSIHSSREPGMSPASRSANRGLKKRSSVAQASIVGPVELAQPRRRLERVALRDPAQDRRGRRGGRPCRG